MNTSKRNHELVLDILYSDLKRDETAVQMARDLQVMTYSDCLMTSRLSCWEDFYLEKITDFQNYCADELSAEHDDLVQKWDAMLLDEQIGVILGRYDFPPMERCSCRCVVEAANK